MQDTFDPTVVQGDSLRWQMAVQNSSGTTYDMVGATLTLQVRKSYYPSSLLYQAQIGVTEGSILYLPDGVTGGIAVDPTNGICNICIGSHYTNKFSTYSGVFYDLQSLKPNNNGTDTLLRGKITILPTVTEI